MSWQIFWNYILFKMSPSQFYFQQDWCSLTTPGRERDNYLPTRTVRISWVSVSLCHGGIIRQWDNLQGAQPDTVEQLLKPHLAFIQGWSTRRERWGPVPPMFPLSQPHLWWTGALTVLETGETATAWCLSWGSMKTFWPQTSAFLV